MQSNPQTTNVDPAELKKFGELAQQWWDPQAEFRSLHDINPLRLQWIDDQATLSGKRVIDVGCGGGLLCEAMAHKGARVTGIDLAAPVLAAARLHCAQSALDIDYELVAAEELALREPAGFDVVTCMEMIEHVPDPASVIRACANLVKPGGHVVFSTINRNPKSYLFAVIGAEYLLSLLPRGTHDYARFVTPSELAHHARLAGLRMTSFVGLHYNPISRRYWLAPNTDVNYMAAAVRDPLA